MPVYIVRAVDDVGELAAVGDADVGDVAVAVGVEPDVEPALPQAVSNNTRIMLQASSKLLAGILKNPGKCI